MNSSPPPMTHGMVVVRRSRPNVAHVVLHRPEQHNAMSIELIRDLRAVLSGLGTDPTVQAVVLAAEGPTFSAGGDLRWMERMLASSREERMAESQELAEMFHELARFPRPVVARVHGPAFVLLGRLVPTVRSLVSIPAGLLAMRFRNFLIASTIGTAMWTALLAGAGYKLGVHYRDIDQIIGPLSNIIIVALIAGYGWRLWSHRPPRTRAHSDQ